MKVFSFIIIFFTTFGLFAAPLESGYSLAPKSSATNEEKTLAYIKARQIIIEESKKHLGTPYKYGGITKSGMDCSGFLFLSFKEALGVSLPRSSSGLYTWTDSITLEAAQPGDLLFFRTGVNKNITHVGLYLGDGEFIHAASSGPKTGVIISSLSEDYWARTYAGAGRAFPEVPSNFNLNTSDNKTEDKTKGGSTSVIENEIYNDASSDASGPRKLFLRKPDKTPGVDKLHMGAAIAPLWNGYIKGTEIIRGFSSNLYIYIETYSLGRRNVFGLEIRPEFDAVFGIFNLPITISWGLSDRFRIFAGPLFSFGKAVIEIEEDKRHYSGKTKVLGTIGITIAPFAIPTKIGNFNPYAEFAWQSFFSDNDKKNFNADIAAGFRISTGIRWLIQIK